MGSGLLQRTLFRCVAGLSLAAAYAAAQPGPSAAVTLEPVATGLASPVLVTHAGDGSGRLFIVEQGGTIRVVPAGGGAPALFLNISGRVLSGGERGLLGLAFHPDFETNRRFFVNYTRRTDGATVIAEYHASTVDPNVADTIEIVLLTIAQPFANHNGGMIAFGPDGFLPPPRPAPDRGVTPPASRPRCRASPGSGAHRRGWSSSRSAGSARCSRCPAVGRAGR